MPNRKIKDTASQSEQAAEEKKQEELVQIVIFSLDEEEYAIPITDIREVVKIPEITPIPESPDFVSGIINLRGSVIAIVDLEKRFQLKREHTDIIPGHIIITDMEDTPFGVIVDQVTEVLRIPVDSIHDAPETVKSKIGSEYIQGVAVLQSDETDQEEDSNTSPEEQESGGERILLLLDIKRILNDEEKRSLQRSNK